MYNLQLFSNQFQRKKPDISQEIRRDTSDYYSLQGGISIANLN